jgi:hypothetical protein
MASPEPFSPRRSDLNPFLFAEVGTEPNGSKLTILSVMGRLGKDPWDEAARLSGLPPEDVVDSLAQSIVQIPLCSQALRDARTTASWLMLLLPAPPPADEQCEGTLGRPKAMPAWLPIGVLCVALALGIAANIILIPSLTALAGVKTSQASAASP